MGDNIADKIADLIKEIQKLTKGPGGAVKALEFVAGAVSTIGDLAGTLTALQSIPALQELFGKPDMQEAVTEILNQFKDLFEALEAQEESDRNRDITIQLGLSRGALRPITEHEPPDFGGNGSLMEKDTSAVLETFKPDSNFWTRLFLKEFVYRDDWAGELEPDHPGLQVFEYVQMLPPFVEAIFNRLCVLRARFDDFPRHQGIPHELEELANSLQHFHDKIVDGIVTERPPTIPEITYRPFTSGVGTVRFRSIWDSPIDEPFQDPIFGFRNFGVVQIYTGVASIGRYPDDRFPNPQNAAVTFPTLEFENDYKRFLAKHAVGTAARFKHFYTDTGLSSVWKMIVHLKKLAGVPVGVAERLDTGSFWSLREVNRLVKENLGIFSPQATVSVAKLMVLLDVKTSVFNLINPESDISRPVSVKKMLEVDAT